jgi:hypothetical protein
VSCNKAGEYSEFASSEVVANVSRNGGDSSSISDIEKKILCSEAPDFDACSALKLECTIVYGDNEDD